MVIDINNKLGINADKYLEIRINAIHIQFYLIKLLYESKVSVHN